MKLFRTVTDILKSFLHIGYYCKMSSNVRWHCSRTPLSPYPYHQPPPDVSGVHWMTSLLSVAPTRIPDLWGQGLESLLSPTQHTAQPRTGPGTWWVFEKWEEAWVQILVLPCICCAASSKLPDLSGPTSLSVEWEYNNHDRACMTGLEKDVPGSTAQHYMWQRLETFLAVTAWEEGVTGSWWVEDRGAAEYPTMHGSALHFKELCTSSCHRAKVENSWYRRKRKT